MSGNMEEKHYRINISKPTQHRPVYIDRFKVKSLVAHLSNRRIRINTPAKAYKADT